jgi:Ca2+-binding RTX toxin-like protein
MHEIGHALGLDHPFEGNIIPDGYDDMRYTIMSYTTPKGVFYAKPGGTNQFTILTPGVYDIAAVQKIYGANMTYHTGDYTYTFKPDQPVYQTIWDAGGNDTLDLSAFVKGCSITLVAGTYSLLAYPTTTLDANIGIAFNCTIENARGGAGNDTIVGNDATNQLRGNAGDDTISGGAGNDLIDGAAGADTEKGEGGNDTFLAGTDTGNDSIDGGDGTDVVTYLGAKAAVTVNLATGTASGTDAGDAAGIGSDSLVSIESVIDSAFNDTLIGSAGADIFSGGAGNDRMTGSSGLDTASYASASGPVTVDLSVTTAQNTVSAGQDTLSGIENLIGSAFNDTLTGGKTANVIDGGAGADAMAGGLGNDTYRVDNVGDTVTEALNAGRDLVVANVTFTLSADIENLTLGGWSAIDGTGNALANVIRGNGAANVLSGGAGADQLLGGGAADTLIGGAGRDVLIGGTGADSFRFANGDFGGLTTSSCDLISDFSHSDGDKIDLSGVDANTLNGSGDDAFAYIGSSAFGHVAGQLRSVAMTGVTVLQGDTNGDGLADFWIRCNGAPALVVGDLIL